MGKIQPFDVLPLPVKKHLRVPYYFALVWIAVLGLVLANLMFRGRLAEAPPDSLPPEAEATNPAAAAALAAQPVRQISVSGDVRIEVTLEAGDNVKISGPGLDGLSLVGSPTEELRLKDSAGKTLFRLKLKDQEDKGKLYDRQGKVVYRLKADDAEHKLKVRRPDNSDLYRMKVKEDKFNILNSAGVRILKGKFKGGRIVVRTDPQDETVLTIDGARDLEEAALLAIPLEAPYRLLLWRAFASP